MKTKRKPYPSRWFRSVAAGVSTGLAVALVLGLMGCGDDDPTTPPPPPPSPTIQSVSRTVVSPGDTILITGENFATPASGNRVTFNNPLAVVVPYYATTTNLGAVVPENAATGPMTVTANGRKSDPIALEVTRNVGDVWVMAGTSLPYTLKVPDPSGSARYLVVPHSASTSPLTYAYSVAPETTSVYPSPGATAAARNHGTVSFAHRFERRIREEAIEYIRRFGAERSFAPVRLPTQAPPDTTTFYVLNTAYGSGVDPANFTLVTAALQYPVPYNPATKALIYSDVDTVSGGFTQADYLSLGQTFDTAIHPTDVGAFGPETDIDGNGKVIILFSRVVNELTANPSGGFIAGFFLLNDLAPGIVPAGTTNGMEIFYVLVPDPNGEIWQTPPKSTVKTIAEQTIAHEFQHMISFGYRFVVLGGGTSANYTQVLWLEEGMAHIAEDLNNMNSSNVSRANLYLADPGATSLMGDDTLQQRGGIYLFLRYLGDQLGNGIYKNILRSSCVGMDCIQNVTGKNFFLSAADFFATLYLSNSAIPHDSRFDFSSINYPAAFNPLPVTTRTVSQGQFNGTVRNAAADYYVIENITAPALTLRISGGVGSAVRLVITRIQ